MYTYLIFKRPHTRANTRKKKEKKNQNRKDIQWTKSKAQFLVMISIYSHFSREIVINHDMDNDKASPFGVDNNKSHKKKKKKPKQQNDGSSS